MNKQFVFGIVLSGLLGGCASLTGNDAPVEDRMGSGTASGSDVAIVEAGPAAQTGPAARTGVEAAPARDTSTPDAMSTQGMRSTDIAESGQAGGAKTQPGTMETHPMPAHLAGGGQKAGEGMHGGGKEGASSMGVGMDLNSPGSLLSKRVIYFDYDSSALRDEFRDLLEAHATYLKAHQSNKVLLQGHADERGSREYNLALGQRRAEGVQQALALLGVDPTQMEAVSLGEEKPAAEGHDESAWSLNRRTEILYQGE